MPFAGNTSKVEPDENDSTPCEERLIESVTADGEEISLQ